MPRSFHWSIASRHFRRFPASTVRLIVTVAAATIIVSICVGVYQLLAERHHDRMEAATISLFLKEEVDPKMAADFASDLMKDATVENVEIDSPDSLRNHFNERYGVNVAEVLPQNPFTTVLRVHVRPSFLNVDTFMMLVQQYREMRSLVDDVGYQSDYIKAVLLESQLLLWTALLGGASLLVLLSALFFFALRAESRFDAADHEVVQLLGSRQRFLNRSAFWRVLICSFIGLVIGSSATWLLVTIAQNAQLIPIATSNMLSLAYGAGVVLILVLFMHRLSPLRR